MLHLWVPNALKLEGDYDWFFEGFTMYVALRTALELKLIKFDGFLNTLGSSYKYYVEHPDELSLVEASETRWTITSGYAHVYIKAMLVAFLYDLMLRKESGGKATLADRYRGLFNGGVTDGANGNEAIIKLLGSSPALKDFVKSYIENRRPLKLEELVRVYGLQVHWRDMKTKLTVGDKLDPDQKQLLRSLGY
jgi:predicted metalloprotease with PDZ domain